MMPFTRYDVSRRAWIDLTDVERTRMSVDYNLRVGLMMAALSFGADPNVKRVSMHIDSIGLEEAVAEQDSAISELMSEALSAFERIRTGDIRIQSRSKGRRLPWRSGSARHSENHRYLIRINRFRRFGWLG